ncbi:hypothetical protein [Tahibacter amnicola]|uniref:DUF4240 domain-containing protein n=1 Tax=Tahibacter amnicola TaxID=2976241 RepID=A0ABY6BKB1_9GAMM|nr:hypothetical protein [Tahibacter amnicola]UXI70446.1 hypothetical protein N4264_12660 [Tahibacter amnicola]
MMDLDEYEDLPETISAAQVEVLVDVFINEQRSGSGKDWFAKLEILADKQWHTYSEPSLSVREKVTSWILEAWEDSDDFLELAMGVAYSFCLRKQVFERAFVAYNGSQKVEFAEMLENSPGDNMDAYWSLRNL